MTIWLLYEQKLVTYFKYSLYHPNQQCNHPRGQLAIDRFTLLNNFQQHFCLIKIFAV